MQSKRNFRCVDKKFVNGVVTPKNCIFKTNYYLYQLKMYMFLASVCVEQTHPACTFSGTAAIPSNRGFLQGEGFVIASAYMWRRPCSSNVHRVDVLLSKPPQQSRWHLQ
jgi:hypothetical protein